MKNFSCLFLLLTASSVLHAQSIIINVNSKTEMTVKAIQENGSTGTAKDLYKEIKINNKVGESLVSIAIKNRVEKLSSLMLVREEGGKALPSKLDIDKDRKIKIGKQEIDLSSLNDFRVTATFNTDEVISAELNFTTTGSTDGNERIAIEPEWSTPTDPPTFTPSNTELESWYNAMKTTENDRLGITTRIDVNAKTLEPSFYILDRKCKTISDDCNWQQVRKERFHPKVGSLTQIRIHELDPITERLEFNTAFKSYFTEDQAKFKGILDGLGGSSSGSESAGTIAKAQAYKEEVLREKIQHLMLLSGELAQLKAWLMSKDILPNSFLTRVYDDVVVRVQAETGINPRVQDALLNHAKQLRKSITPEGQAQFDAAVAKAILNLDEITQLGFRYFLPIEIRNEDEMDLKVKHFRNNVQVGAEEAYTFRNKGGFKLDFSLGVVGTNLIDHTYVLSTAARQDTVLHELANNVETDSIASIRTLRERKIVRSNDGDLRVSAGVLMHAYFRTGGLVNPALNFGFLLSNDAPVAYLFGGSLMILKDQRICISGGATLGSVTCLDPRYEPGGILVTQDPGDTTDPAVPTITRQEWGYYFSLSFNLVQAVPTAKK